MTTADLRDLTELTLDYKNVLPTEQALKIIYLTERIKWALTEIYVGNNMDELIVLWTYLPHKNHIGNLETGILETGETKKAETETSETEMQETGTRETGTRETEIQETGTGEIEI